MVGRYRASSKACPGPRERNCAGDSADTGSQGRPREIGGGIESFVGLSASVALASAQALQPGKTWTNLHGSTLVIKNVSPDCSFTGTFTNQTKGFACKGVPYPVTGWQDGIIISFTVRFDNGTT